MRAGNVIDGRFEIVELAGAGGMGHVFRSRDRETGEIVALKVLQNAASQDSSRLAREAQALATLRLPGVVRYIAHGLTELGHPYLAMEWLTGETLSQRLARKAFTLDESLALGRRVATTLGAVHRLGVVHRDLKPSNLLLVDGAIDRVTLIDFGVVRMSGLDQQLTMPGAILGTPGYMAPEQARGEAQVDPRADVFALGCVLYKCISGRAPFRGARGLAVLVKVLIEEPPSLRWLCEEVPEPLDDLVRRMLSKSPDGRPRDGHEVAAELAALSGATGTTLRPPASSLRPPELTTGERKVMCLVLARDGLAPAAADPASAEVDEQARAQALSATAARYRGQLELIEARLPLVVLSGAGATTDLAARAARCALAVQALLGGAPVAVVTGRAEIASRLPVGDLIDRVVHLLPETRAPSRAAIRIDEVTAGLLGTRFEITADEGGPWLHGAREEPEAPPHLLGRATPCVGRERELALIRDELARCVEESSPSVVLVTGPAGIGKSRLRHELVRMIREEGEPVDVWLGQVDPMSAGSAFGLLAHALRRVIGLSDADSIEERRRKVRARVEQHAGLDAGRVTTFLGELVGAPFPDDDVQLRAARRNPMLMGDQLRLAWEDFLRAECAAQPILLVLEDLHWGDLPTVTMVDAALRNLRDRPFMVMALGRPEVHELFPKLWDERRGHKLRLAGISRRASERLVRQVLGEGERPELVSTLVERADGNVFYLEEQIRAAAAGKGADLPETVLSMVQAELDALDTGARRLLRAGAIFGESFSRGGVLSLVGKAEVEPLFAQLEARELIVRRAAEGASDAVEYRFRHALVREAAYGMLTEHDRRLGHRLAGAWLERTGGADAMALAEHFERGGEPVRAATWYLRAAEQALFGDDLGAAIERVERGVACGPARATAGALRLCQAEAHLWRGELALAERRGAEALERLAAGSAPWFSALTQLVIAASKRGNHDQVERWVRAAQGTEPASAAARPARSVCLCAGAGRLVFGGRYQLADALFDAIEQEVEAAEQDAEVLARLSQARAYRAMAGGDPGACLAGFEAALAAFEQAGDRRNACWARNNLGFCYAELGDFEGAEAALRAALSDAERMGLSDARLGVLHNLGPVLAHRGLVEEARRAEEEAIATSQRVGDARMEGAARTYLARILLLSGDLAGAEREARAAVATLYGAPPFRAFAYAVLGRALLDAGQAADALAATTEAFCLLESVGAETGESLVRLAHAEALAACGHQREALMAIASARDSLLSRAMKISDPVWRGRFLGNVPDNVATLEVERRWLSAGSSGESKLR
ncbi:protein kinase [Sorangium cellulosum]|uniref:Protein kinase n=1 Tax=Sorangium cellulosum TaxID=56 RepID=A0A4P2Q4Q1_SORCE|nr:protein kinase [Sorangium cellulosum]AUX24016.1 protein kinase [Sorangium cellulosum]